MRIDLQKNSCWWWVALLAICVGCSKGDQGGSKQPAAADGEAAPGTKDSAPGASATKEGEEADPDPAKPFQLGDLIEPFTPPTLAELDAKVTWEDSPVVDSKARLREQKKLEPPLVTVEEALSMRNDSIEANTKILSALSVLASPDGSDVNWDATMNRAFLMDLSSMNPLLSNSVAESEMTGLTSAGLFGFDWNMVPFASADRVKSWQTSTDHLYDKVVMRDDMTWSDGKPITAHDVVFSYKLIMTEAVPIPAQRTGTDELKWVEAYDDYTLVFFHKQAAGTNIWNMNFQVIPKHIYEKSAAEDPKLRSSAYHRNLENHPVSGGAYEVERWTRGQEVVVKRRESYYMHNGKQVRKRPYFARMRFRIIEDANTRLLALKSGDIDESELETEQWQTQSNNDEFYRENTKVSGVEWLYLYVGWNMDTKKVPFFGDLRVREAMAHAMNYDEMINVLCYGIYERCLGIFHPTGWMYPKNPPEAINYNLDKAEDLLDAAGWVDSDGDGIRDKEIDGKRVKFEFSMLVSNKPDRIAICNLFRENLESIGVICNITPMEAAVFQERIFNKNFEAEMSGWATGADPSLTKNIFGTGQGRNFGSYSNPEVDRLYVEAQKEFDRDKQAELYGKIHTLIYQDQPYMFLYNRHSLYGFNKKLRGYRFSPRGPFHFSPGIDAIWSP